MSGPHDLLARFTLGQPEPAAAELRAVLPPAIISQVDWSTLQRESSSVIDAELRETESDLLFSATTLNRRPLLIYVLLEHQSSVDRWMPFRMLRYVVRQLEHWRTEHPESQHLPLILPLVLYHGPGGAWTAPRCVEELFDIPNEEEWLARVPRFEYLLDDLTVEREEKLMERPGPPSYPITLLFLRFGRTGELAVRLPNWRGLFAKLETHPMGRENLKAFFRYLIKLEDKATSAVAKEVLGSVMGAQSAEELMLSYGDELIEQGRQEGLAKGRVEGRAEGRVEGRAEGQARGQAESVLRVLAMRAVRVDDEVRQRILSCTDLTALDTWLARAVNASFLSDVFDDLAQ